MKFVQVVFPFSLEGSFTYSVPQSLLFEAEEGKRALAPLGQRLLTGYITEVSDSSDNLDLSKIKHIVKLIDEKPLFSPGKLKFYSWLAEYYMSSLGEALRLADPFGKSIKSERIIRSDPEIAASYYFTEKNKNTVRAKILQILSEKPKISLKAIQKTLGKKNLYKEISTLKEEGVISDDNELNKEKKAKVLKFVRLNISSSEVYNLIPELERRSPKQVEFLIKISSLKDKEIQLGKISEITGVGVSSIESLQKKGIVTIFEKTIERKYSGNYAESAGNFTLTKHQQIAIDTVEKTLFQNIFKPFLLFGVTGSGKTQVYIELIKKVVEKGGNVILLVPEISLTPQMTARLISNFGDDVALIHSRVPPGERYDAWVKIAEGRAKVVTGPRSALFAPFDKIDLIIVDEEHDSSYKSTDLSPRYQARDAAVYLASLSKCPVLLGSATPSVESTYNARTGKYELLELPFRVDNAQLPDINFIDLTQAAKVNGVESVFAKETLSKIDERIKKNEGVIILQNRRGFATQLYCVECGTLEMCDNCSVSMVYHINGNYLMCHYCSTKKDKPKLCSSCGSEHLVLFGTGTERVEDELVSHFPDAVIERIDSDSISEKGKLGTILNDFRDGKIDILTGTQMVSKGLDFPRVTLVGVVSAEATLWIPDFRADEKTFQLLTQVSGRAGRSSLKGEVLIQTKDKSHYVLKMVLNSDYEGFYMREIKNRQFRQYPPFANLLLIEMKDLSEEKARESIIAFYKELNLYRKYINISAPAQAVIYKLRNEYRYQIVIKSLRTNDPTGSTLRKAVRTAHASYLKSAKFKDVRTLFDFNPYSVV